MDGVHRTLSRSPSRDVRNGAQEHEEAINSRSIARQALKERRPPPLACPRYDFRDMPRQVQRYVTELLVEILGPAEVEKRFDWCRGDSRNPGGRGIALPFDAVWESRKLIVEVDEVQHDKPVRHFDKPGKLTVSGVHRGEQRKLYDERKGRLAGESGYQLVDCNR